MTRPATTVTCEAVDTTVWHAVDPTFACDGDCAWHPIRCGDGIAFPGPTSQGEPTCPDCRRILADSEGPHQ